jgi:hypothetical protein
VSAAPLDRQTPAEAVGGFLASLAIFAALIGIAWHPLRLIPFALIASVIATTIGGRYQRLAMIAMMITAASFFLGMTVAVIVKHPLW